MLSNARHLLARFRSPSRWKRDIERDIERYRQVAERLRGYEVDGQRGGLQIKPVCVDRYEVYEKALCRPLPHRAWPVRWADAGEYLFPNKGGWASVTLPDDMVLPPPVGYDFATRQRPRREAVTVPWRS